jgi:pimeloyl-ACP methyl ester carboxylesterase
MMTGSIGATRRTTKEIYVLVHGAWHGAWCWRPVEALLQELGAQVFTPTLTGLGDRTHLLNEETGLSTHIADVKAAIESEDLHDVVLVGHSYAGMVVTGVAAQIPERIKRLVIVDGFLPEAGEMAINLLPERAASHYLESARKNFGLVIDPRPVANLGVTDQQIIDELTPRLTPQPAKTYMEPIKQGLEALPFPGEYLLCSGWSTPFSSFALRATAAGWKVTELNADHEVLVTNAELLVRHLAMPDAATSAA